MQFLKQNKYDEILKGFYVYGGSEVKRNTFYEFKKMNRTNVIF